jgi:glycine hydroxymethyltransferase
MSDTFIFPHSLPETDPDLHHLLELEEQRQAETIILIASESEAPAAVRQAMSSAFGNIYAEGYPREESRRQTEAEILDVDLELAHYRRYSDPRYYKGVEYADVVEALTRRRAAELFAANGVTADNLYVNVQPLSGAPANSAVYTALLQPGDTILGLNLNDGGHLTHGTRINRSGKHYNGVPYFVDEQTEKLDYDEIERLALEHKPKLLWPATPPTPSSSTGSASARLPTKWGPTCWPTSPTFPGWWPAGCTPAPSASPTSFLPPPTKACAGRAAPCS